MKKIKKQHKLDKKIIQLLQKKPYKLFLDDVRTVDMVFSGEDMEGWTVCRSSQEAIEIFNHCDRTIIATSNESYDVLAPYIKKAKEDTHSCGFTQYGVFPE